MRAAARHRSGSASAVSANELGRRTANWVLGSAPRGQRGATPACSFAGMREKIHARSAGGSPPTRRASA